MVKKMVLLVLLLLMGSWAPASSQDQAQEKSGAASPASQPVAPGDPYVLPPDDQRETARLSDLCKGIDNTHRCAQAIERAQLPRYPQVVTRLGGNLNLTLKSGQKLILKDTEGVSGTAYSFRDYLKDLWYFLIHYQLWEGDGYLLVHDRTGKKYSLDDLPILAPDKKRLVTISEDLIPRYNANAIKVWRLSPQGLTLEWSLEPKDWGPVGGKWLDNNTVSLSKKIPTGKYGETFRKAPALLKKTPTGWKLVDK